MSEERLGVRSDGVGIAHWLRPEVGYGMTPLFRSLCGRMTQIQQAVSFTFSKVPTCKTCAKRRAEHRSAGR